MSHRQTCSEGAQQSSPDLFGAYFFAIHESSRAQPNVLRSFQCFPARTPSQYLHLVRARVFFGVFLRRRAQKFLNFEWRLRANGFGVREKGQGRPRAGAAGELRHVGLTTRPRSERAEVQILRLPPIASPLPPTRIQNPNPEFRIQEGGGEDGLNSELRGSKSKIQGSALGSCLGF